MTIRVFGLTGGIGSGKSTVARHWRGRGLPVIDADELAREVVEPGTEGLAAVTEAFGAEVLDAEGRLDRKALAARVFCDDALRRRLNALIHPRVQQRTAERVAEAAAQGEPLACYDVPLLVESRLVELLRPVVVVSATPEQQVERTMARDGLARAEVEARMAAQRPLAEKVALADYVIDNAGTREATLAAADAALRSICSASGVPAARYGL